MATDSSREGGAECAAGGATRWSASGDGVSFYIGFGVVLYLIRINYVLVCVSAYVSAQILIIRINNGVTTKYQACISRYH